MKALLNVDYTNDFIADEGALTCGKPGQALETRITELTKEFVDNGDFVCLAIDLHVANDPYHPETKLFPPHNLANTWGRKLYGQLEDYYQIVKNHPNVYYMDKTRYSAFAGTDLAIKLKERSITEVHIVGVCTDICVLHTAIDAYNQGFKVVVHEDGVASFDEQGHKWALKHFTSCLDAKVVSK